MAYDFVVKVGDAGSALRHTLLGPDGNPTDLQGVTGIRWHMADAETLVELVNQPATNDQVGDGADGSKGFVSYVWQSADIGTVERVVVGEWQVTYSGGAVLTYPNDGYLVGKVVPEVT